MRDGALLGCGGASFWLGVNLVGTIMKTLRWLIIGVLIVLGTSQAHGPSMPPDPWDPCCPDTVKYCPPCK